MTKYPLADRMNLLDSSGIRKVFNLAKQIKDPINLSIGLPDFDMPDLLKETAVKAIHEGMNRYTLTQGIDELRHEIQNDLKNRSINLEEIMITSGVSGGLFLSFISMFNAGDEVMIPDPYFVMYKHLLKLLDVKPVYTNTYPNFKMTADKIEPLITSKTKAIILNSPANPTGVCLTHDEIKEVCTLAQKYQLTIISDEIYRHFSYDNSFCSPAEFYENTLILDGFSKSHAMTGWRLGFAAGPKPILDNMVKLQQYSFVCAPSVAQQVGIKAMQLDPKEYVQAYQVKRDLVFEGLKNHYHLIKPQGAFYFFIKTPNEQPANQFVEKAIQNKLLIIPGNIFSEKNTHFRLSFAAENHILEKGIDILRKLSVEH